MTLYHDLITSRLLPWRVRSPLEFWVENHARSQYPGLYRWLHVGRTRDPVIPLTHGPRHHFFGYYDKSPWNRSERYLLAHEAGFNDRAPGAGDSVGIGVVEASDNSRYLKLADGHAWNWQQGAMAQWHPADLEHLFVYNDRRDGRFVSVVRHTARGEINVYDLPIYALLPDGSCGFSLNFARLAAHRPGYGYAGVPDRFADAPAPSQDGIWRMDLASGRAQLVVSLAELASRDQKASMENAWHYVNHIQPSRAGSRIAFFHIWHSDPRHWTVRLYSCRPDGSELRCLLDTGFISHYDWRDEDTLLVWANRPAASPRFLQVSHASHELTVEGEGVLAEDGHCSYSPNGRWVLNDTYPDVHGMRTLMLYQPDSGRRIDLARLYSPKDRWWGEIRCDLHPRWSRSGDQVCFDSVHQGTRQMYVVDVREWFS